MVRKTLKEKVSYIKFTGYINGDWVGSPTYKKSTLGYYIIMEVKLLKNEKKSRVS